MNVQRFTENPDTRSRRRRTCGKLGNTQVEPEHLLQVLIEQPEGVVPAILSRVDVPQRQVAQNQELLARLARAHGGLNSNVSPELRAVLVRAHDVMAEMKMTMSRLNICCSLSSAKATAAR
jgi:ATP-dependent Clp protease ATP-binding subunit ClpA